MDERDVMFARAARRPGTPAYEDYYRRHPERQAVDDRLRALPELLLPGGRHYDERTCRDAIHYFHAIDEIAINAKDVERWASEVRAIGDVTHAVRDGLLRHGALGVGFAPIDPSAVYSHKGRFDGDYGQSVELRHPAAVVFLVEMDFDAMQHAPRAEVIRESARQYWRAAVLARTLEASLEAAGFETKAQYDAHYDVIVTHEGDHDSGIAPAHWGLGAKRRQVRLDPRPRSVSARGAHHAGHRRTRGQPVRGVEAGAAVRRGARSARRGRPVEHLVSEDRDR